MKIKLNQRNPRDGSGEINDTCGFDFLLVIHNSPKRDEETLLFCEEVSQGPLLKPASTVSRGLLQSLAWLQNSLVLQCGGADRFNCGNARAKTSCCRILSLQN